MTGVLSDAARDWFSIGFGTAFLISMGYLFLLLQEPKIDLGWLGLMFLLTIIFFLIGFSFLVAAATPGYEIKLAVGVVDAFVLIGSKLLAPSFLRYLGDEEQVDDIPSRRGTSKNS